MDVKQLGATESFRSTAVVIKTTPTPLPATALPDRRSIYVFNNEASAKIYVGPLADPSGVPLSTSTGTPIVAQTGLALDAAPSVVIYGIIATGTGDGRVAELA